MKKNILQFVYLFLLLVARAYTNEQHQSQYNREDTGEDIAYTIDKRWVDVDDEKNAAPDTVKHTSESKDNTDFTKIIENFNDGITKKLGSLGGTDGETAEQMSEQDDKYIKAAQQSSHSSPIEISTKPGELQHYSHDIDSDVNRQIQEAIARDGNTESAMHEMDAALAHGIPPTEVIENVNHGTPSAERFYSSNHGLHSAQPLYTPNHRQRLSEPVFVSNHHQRLSEPVFVPNHGIHSTETMNQGLLFPESVDASHHDLLASEGMQTSDRGIFTNEAIDVPHHATHFDTGPENLAMQGQQIYRRPRPIHKFVGAPIHRFTPGEHRFVPMKHIFLKHAPEKMHKLRFKPVRYLPRPRIIIVKEPHIQHHHRYCELLFCFLYF